MVRFLLARSADVIDAVDGEGCTPLWAAAYNGCYQAALLLLSRGPDLSIAGKARGGAAMTAAVAARSQRNPTIADAIDAEKELRRRDEARQAKLRRGDLDYDAFRASLRTVSKNR